MNSPGLRLSIRNVSVSNSIARKGGVIFADSLSRVEITSSSVYKDFQASEMGSYIFSQSKETQFSLADFEILCSSNPEIKYGAVSLYIS